MADKPNQRSGSTKDESVAEFARRELAEEKERQERKAKYWAGQKRVAIELPARFFKIAAQIRAEVDTFNQIVDVKKRMSLEESAGLAARADHLHAELNLTVRRGKAELWMGLSELMRLGNAPPAYIIESHVHLSQARLRLRAEGIPRGDDTRYRVTIDGRESGISLDDLAERLVLAVAKDDPAVLGAATETV